MADIKISQLVELQAADLTDSDVLIINDVSTTTTKQITFGNLLSAYTENVVDSDTGAKVTGDFEVENELTIGGDTFTTGKITFGSLQDYTENIFISKFVDEADGIANNNNDSCIPTSAAVKGYVDGVRTVYADSGTGDGLTTTLTLINGGTPVSIANTQVYIDGVYQMKSTYSLTDDVITFSEAPPNLSRIEVITL